ncbi:Transposase and inactivated derivatives, IS30 family [Carnobacterium alterfunditum]|uniref:Transposase and inactivated derivatives, IS30 family n=1 Tax=Carnobacterium alterfunditum TaxID=28230 RepID=A0A1N6GUW0_9LACT|nr:IS30 family transposase [Carnobacterium alterfunditum]SIO03405.1 Transposase and inactivated derivatives, IS30 family [Carnobacterium alterfunditum]SIO07181.1 Transposase and inactivated derivatives, IS30 family [Carnobacterium alterfunditum]SIO11371.1 Transposase and inactivated derivatives, IS30 family [Carnobacterium alterfunditum]SIO21758.1 Transposase and inactivated derivatives, IS30 family [Carnobacterium alterfunditum]
MTHSNDNTPARKGKHLSYSERSQIAILKQEDYSNRPIAIVLNRVPQTINNEIKRGTITQLKRQKQKSKIYDYFIRIYDAGTGQAVYDKHRLNCGRRPKWADTDAFIEWADDKMLTDKWSPDVVVGFALKHELFDPTIIPCTTTLYYWIDREIMRTKNLDLLEKLSRKPKVLSLKKRPNKRILGQSIDNRPKEIDNRKTFGHWEIDTVIGNKIKTDAVLLTLVERQTRLEVIMKINGKDQESVNQAIRTLQARSREDFPTFFKTITSDNGSEFAGLDEALKDTLDVYFSHPYASFERGTSENQHKFIRRFIPKGKPISQFTETQCLRIQQWMNDYPRKILDYRTPHDCFVNALRLERQTA